MLGRWFACNDVGNARWDSFRIMFLGSLGCVPASPTVVAWSETGARSCVHQSSAWSSTCSPYAHRKFGLLRFSSHRFTSVAVHTKLSLPCFRRAGFSPEVRSQWNVRKQLHDQSQLTCAKTKHFKAPSCHAEGTPGTIVLAGSSVQKPQSADVTKLSPHLETEEERPLAGRKPLAKKLEAGRQWGKAVHEEGSGRTWSDRFNGAVSSTPDADKDGVQTETVVSLDTRTPQLEASEGSTVAGAGHTLLERGTRLINTSPREGRWREARPKRHSEDAEAVVSSRSSALESRAPQSSLDAIFEQGEPGRGRQKLRFTRNPQPDVGSIDNQDAGTSSRSTAKSPIATPFLRDQVVKNGGSWRRNPSSGLLAGYETADEFETKGTGASAGAGSEWVVETCPVCHGTATLVCDVCDSGWPPGACPACKGVGYKACTHCHGSGKTYRRTKRVQPPKSLSKAPARTTSVEDEPEEEEGPSLLEAYRIIKNERQRQSATSGANGHAAVNGAPHKAPWLIGRPKSEEHRAKISRALQGRPRSPLTSSHRRKLSDLRREFFEEPGARERWSELAKKFWAPRKRVMHCSHCGLQGHNSRFCPELGFVKSTNKPCPICGQPGHGRGGSCPKRGLVRIPFRCKKCGEYGHEAGQCPNSAPFPGRTLCEICGLPGHRVRECPERPKELIIQRCSICGQPGHNRKRCPQRTDSKDSA